MTHGCEAHLDPVANKDPRKLGAHSKSGTDTDLAFDSPLTDVKSHGDHVTDHTMHHAAMHGHEVSHHAAMHEVSHHAPSMASERDDDDLKKKADVAGALEAVSPKEHDDKKDAPLDMHPNKLRHKIKSAHATLEHHLSKSKEEHSHHPLIKAAKEHLKEAKTHVEHIATVEVEVMKKHHEEKATAVASKKASEDAQAAATKLETTKTMAKMGKATTKDVEHAQKHMEHKKKLASEKATKHVKASTDKKKAEAKLDSTKKATAAHIDAAVKTTTVAAKTSKESSATATATTVKHHVGDMTTHKVKTDCTFLDTILLGDLKHMPEVDKEFPCVGLGTYADNGHAKLGAVKCKPTPMGACPTEFTADLCHVVPLNVGNVHFKPLFKK